MLLFLVALAAAFETEEGSNVVILNDASDTPNFWELLPRETVFLHVLSTNVTLLALLWAERALQSPSRPTVVPSAQGCITTTSCAFRARSYGWDECRKGASSKAIPHLQLKI